MWQEFSNYLHECVCVCVCREPAQSCEANLKSQAVFDEANDKTIRIVCAAGRVDPNNSCDSDTKTDENQGEKLTLLHEAIYMMGTKTISAFFLYFLMQCTDNRTIIHHTMLVHYCCFTVRQRTGTHTHTHKRPFRSPDLTGSFSSATLRIALSVLVASWSTLSNLMFSRWTLISR